MQLVSNHLVITRDIAPLVDHPPEWFKRFLTVCSSTLLSCVQKSCHLVFHLDQNFGIELDFIYPQQLH